MKINDYMSKINDISFEIDAISKKVTKNEIGTFEEVYNGAMNILNETNELVKERDRLEIDFATGKSDDMLGVAIAQQKASDSVNFTVQVVNKVVEAYKEIMRLQI